MASTNYMYGNIVSTLHSSADHNKAWYSSTGWGNVSYGNLTILRTPRELIDAGSKATVETEGYQKATEGDGFNQSGLFYFYFGPEYSSGGVSYLAVDYDGKPQYGVKERYDGTYEVTALNNSIGQSLAGHWWEGIKEGDVNLYLGYNNKLNVDAWRDRFPSYINIFYGTELILDLYDLYNKGEDYHIKYFYHPWYLTYDANGKRKTFTSDPLPEDALIWVPEYTYLEPVEGGYANQVNVVTVPEKVITERNADGSVTLTYEQIAAMERSRRSPQYSVVMNNVILGSSPKYITEGSGNNAKLYPINQPEPTGVVTDTVLSSSHRPKELIASHGYLQDFKVENNCMIFDYEDLAPYAYTFDYTLSDDAWDFILDVGAEDPSLTVQEAELENIKYISNNLQQMVGPTYDDFDEFIYFEDIYPEFDWNYASNEGFYWKAEIREID